MAFIQKYKLYLVMVGLVIVFGLSFCHQKNTYEKSIVDIKKTDSEDKINSINTLKATYNDQISKLESNKTIIDQTEDIKPDKERIITTHTVKTKQKEVVQKQNGVISDVDNRQEDKKEENVVSHSEQVKAVSDNSSYAIIVGKQVTSIQTLSTSYIPNVFGVGYRVIGDFWVEASVITTTSSISGYQISIRYEF